LKLFVLLRGNPIRVAPFTGAWIETDNARITEWNLMSRPSRARGLKLLGDRGEGELSRRALHGRVD